MTAKQIDYDDPKRNMYGVLPCPKCGSKYRYPMRYTAPQSTGLVIVCDDCKTNEPVRDDDPADGEG